MGGDESEGRYSRAVAVWQSWRTRSAVSSVSLVTSKALSVESDATLSRNSADSFLQSFKFSDSQANADSDGILGEKDTTDVIGCR